MCFSYPVEFLKRFLSCVEVITELIPKVCLLNFACGAEEKFNVILFDSVETCCFYRFIQGRLYFRKKAPFFLLPVDGSIDFGIMRHPCMFPK